MAEILFDDLLPTPATQGQGLSFDDLVPPTAAAKPKTKPSIARDVISAIPSGIARGATETVMLPATIDRLGNAAGDYLAGKVDPLIRAIFGADPRTPADDEKIRAAREGGWSSKLDETVNGAQDAVRGFMDDHLYEPQTRPGRFAETVSEFAVPGGAPSRATRLAEGLGRRAASYAGDLVRGAVAPGVTSEAAGQITEGTVLEPYARVAGAVAGNVGGALASAAGAPESVLRRAVGDPDAINWDAATRLQNNSTGVRLTGPEAITQAQDGATSLPNLLRLVEGSNEGRAAIAPFFAERPGQVDRAVGSLLDLIAPQSANPSALGPRAAQAAERAITASPSGQALVDAIVGAGPRTSPLEAGRIIQPELRRTFDRREGMRNALGDRDYRDARAAEPTVPVDDLTPQNTVREPGYTRLDPSEDVFGQQTMAPTSVPPTIETPSLTSNTGPDLVQVDARPALRSIDALRANERGAAASALDTVRGLLFRNGGVDTSVAGLENARDSINGMITTARQGGDMHVVERLTRAREALDRALSTSPEFAQANRNFAAASEPLGPFSSPGVEKVVRRDEFNQNFATPPEQVADLLSAPSEAQNFNRIASPAAADAMQNSLVTKLLDGATDAGGNVAPERLAALMRDNEDTLSQFPAVRERLASIVDRGQQVATERHGPVADVAAARDTAAAGNALLPANPMTGSEQETVDAVRRLVSQDSETTPALVRQTLADRYARASTETQEGSREFAGAKFRKDVAGNAPRDAVLDAVLRGLPDQAAAEAMPELLDVLQATGRRKPIGSATEFNRAANAELSQASGPARALNAVGTLGASFVTGAGDALKRTALRGSLNQLADLFTDPRSVELIREAVARGAPNRLPEAIARSAVQSAVTGHR